MKKVNVEEQRQINGGWCLKSNRKFDAIHHYYNGRFSHTDWYANIYSNGWFYYGR